MKAHENECRAKKSGDVSPTRLAQAKELLGNIDETDKLQGAAGDKYRSKNWMQVRLAPVVKRRRSIRELIFDSDKDTMFFEVDERKVLHVLATIRVRV